MSLVTDPLGSEALKKGKSRGGMPPRSDQEMALRKQKTRARTKSSPYPSVVSLA